MDPARKTLVTIASISRQVFNKLVSHTGHKTAETFQLERIVIASGALLEALNKALFLGSGTVDDRLLDWLHSEEPKQCLDTLNRMEELLSEKIDHGYGVKNFFRSSRSGSTKDQSNEAIRHFRKHEVHFHFLLSTEIWNRESGLRQQPEGVPQSDALHVNKVSAKQDLKQITRDQVRDQSSIAEEGRTRKQCVNAKKVNSIVKWLKAWNSEDIHERTLHLRQPDTCTWLLNTNIYKTWRSTEDSFLWLHGKAGAGKSVLAASVINDLESSLLDGEALAYFYCDFRSDRSTGPAEVMRSLLSQLLQEFDLHITDPGDLIDDLVKQKDKRTSVSTGKLACYVSRAAKHLNRQPFVVLDALDECKDVEELLQALEELKKGGIRIFVTSRPLQIIKEGLSNNPSINMDMMNYELSADIKLHITREVDSHRRLRIVEASLKNDIHSVLCEKAGGMFRWVQCQLTILKQCVTGVQVREALNDLPSSLEETYKRILLKMSEDKCGADVAQSALRWLVVAQGPLRLIDIMDGLSIDLVRRVVDHTSGPVHGLALLDVLGSLVTYNEVTDVVILSHFSVKEYLIAESTRAKHPAYHVDQQAAHKQLVLRFICYIGIYLEQSRRSGEYYMSPQETRGTGIRLHDAAAQTTQNHGLRLRSPKFPLLDGYLLFHGFEHLAHIDPNNTVLRAIENLHSEAQQHPAEWNELCRRSLWPTVNHDIVTYILIAFAPEPFLHLLLYHTKFKLKDGTNPLIYAAHLGKIEHARTLLARGVKLNRRGWDVGGRSQVLPLEAAVDCGHRDLVDLFLAEGTPVPHELFVMALRGFNLPVKSRLLQTDEFVEWATNAEHEKLLLRVLDSSRYGYSEHRPSEQDVDVIQRRFLQLGCDPSTRSNEAFLRHAVSAGLVSIVKHILSLNTPFPPDIILDAARSKTFNAEMIRLCLDMGSDVHTITSTEDTLIHLSLASVIHEDDCLERVQVLVDVGCAVTACNLAGEAPIHLAVSHGLISAVEYILSLDVPLPSDILIAASKSPKPSVIRLLMSKGADIHAISANGNAVLHSILDGNWCTSDHLDCIKVLVNAGCKPYLRNAQGKTAFDIAAERGHLSVVQYLYTTLNSSFPPDILLSVAGSPSFNVTPVLKFLIDKGAVIQVTRPNGDTPLHLAIMADPLERERLERTRILINAGCDPRTCNLAGETPFHLAARYGQSLVMEYLLSLGVSLPSDIIITWLEGDQRRWNISSTIRFLLDKGGDVRAVAKNGDTLLHLAANLSWEDDALELTKHLVDSGCDPCALNLRQETPLHIAAQQGFVSVIEYLRSLNIPLPPDILLAASKSDLANAHLIRYLVKEGASVSVATTEGDTSLHLLLHGEEDSLLECVEILIDAGCNPCAQNLAGETPLYVAARSGFCNIMEYLLSRGVPLPHDVLRASTPTTIRFLLDKGLDLRSVSIDGLTELTHRVLRVDPFGDSEKNFEEFASLLVGAGWDPSLTNSAGETAIHVAARNGHIHAIKYFLSKNVQLPSDVLLAAAAKVWEWYELDLPIPLTRFLIREGASVNATASNGDSPLHITMSHDFIPDRNNDSASFIRPRRLWEVVEILLNSGADPSARNAEGQTPFDVAEAKGHFFNQNFLRLVQNARALRLGS